MAALTVVMGLFFALALAAAYTNRNMVFEQRMSAGSMRSERAAAAAEAGVDWAVAMLNAGPLDNRCRPSQDAAATDLRTKLFSYNADQRSYAMRGTPDTQPLPGCQITATANGPQLFCVCPSLGDAAMNTDGGNVNDSAFRIDFQPPGNAVEFPAGAVILQVRGCSSAGNGASACYRRTSMPATDSLFEVRANLGLLRALPAAPNAALTAGRAIDAGGAVLRVANAHAGTGLALHAGGAITVGAGSQVLGPPGAPAGAPTLANDDRLDALATSGNFFNALFGMDVQAYRRQPAASRIDCNAACGLADVTAALANAPSRVVWVDGNLTLDAAPPAGTMGSDAAPMMLVVNGTLTLGANYTMVGFVYATNVVWTGGAAGASLRGALVAADRFSADAGTTVGVAYDAAVLNQIVDRYGSFVRAPGGWNRNATPKI